MLTKLKKLKAERSDQGFTIIEVMIVLAIAGLILLIVFLAVPALQRNARNTTLKSDASAIAAGITEYVSNNNGAMPTTFAQAGSSITISAPGSTAPTNAQVNGATVVSVVSAVPANTTIGTGTVKVFPKTACGSATAVSRESAVYYGVEVSGGVNVSCIQT